MKRYEYKVDNAKLDAQIRETDRELYKLADNLRMKYIYKNSEVSLLCKSIMKQLRGYYENNNRKGQTNKGVAIGY